MARVSLDSGDASSGKDAASGDKPSKPGSSGKGSSVDQSQMIKVGGAIAVIVLAGVWILYSQGVFDSATRPEPRPPTPEETAEFKKLEEEQKEAEREIERRGGIPPSRLGSG